MQLLQIQDIHILKHHDSQKPKGAFVEFSTKEELADALTRNGEVCHVLQSI